MDIWTREEHEQLAKDSALRGLTLVELSVRTPGNGLRFATAQVAMGAFDPTQHRDVMARVLEELADEFLRRYFGE